MPYSTESLAARSAEVILGPNPIIGLRLRDVVGGAVRGALLAARQPRTTVTTLTGFGRELVRVARDTSELRPPPQDRRFADPAWRERRGYRAWLQAYLAWTRALRDWLGAQKNLDDLERARLAFLAELASDALAPSNFPWQPAARRRYRETNGQSARDGLKNFLTDLRTNRGLPAQVDTSTFKLGENLANTAGAVVHRTEVMELIQYRPRAAQVGAIPLLIVPPQINKYYIFDLSPEKSVVRALLDAGFHVFVISWRNPTRRQAAWGLAEYAAAIDTAMTTVCGITGQDSANVLGACAGGITLSSYVAARAATGDRRVRSLTLLVSVLDTSALGDTALGLFGTPSAVEAARRYSAAKGVLDGKDLSTAFAWLRPNDLIWNYWVNNVLLGNRPPAFDILYWNNDVTRLPARLHGEFLDIYRSNALAGEGALRLHGTPVDLRRIRCDAYLLAGTTDHITPWQACYRTTQFLGGKTTFVLSNSGHIQSILSPPGSKKAEFWWSDAPGADAGAWREAARHESGSWWPHWHAWLKDRSGPTVDAPATLGNADHPEICPAPGEYVRG